MRGLHIINKAYIRVTTKKGYKLIAEILATFAIILIAWMWIILLGVSQT